MTRLTHAFATAIVLHVFMLAGAAQSVYPTGTTIYDPDRAWNGFTVLSPLATQAVLVIDMNGNVVKRWDGFNNSAGRPGARVAGRRRHGGQRRAPAAPGVARARAAGLRRQGRSGGSRRTSRSRRARAERSGRRASTTTGSGDFPAGYYSPEGTPARSTAATRSILTHTNRTQPKVADVLLEDDRLIEVSPDGEHHLGVGARAITSTSSASPPMRGRRSRLPPPSTAARGSFDWLHVNSATYRRAEPMVRRRRQALRPEQRDHQQPRSQPARHRRPRRLDRLAARSRLQPVERAARDPPDHRPASRAPHPERAAGRRATCWCSTTAARAATASPTRSRPRAAARSRARRRACSRSTR